MNSKYYKNVLKKRIGYLVLLVCVIAIGAIVEYFRVIGRCNDRNL